MPFGIAVLLVGAAAAALLAWRGGGAVAKPSAEAPPTPVAAMVVRTETLPRGLEAIGSLQAVRQVILSPEVAGRVTAINFDAGTDVAAGAPLVQLYDAPLRASRAVAVSKGRFAQLQEKRSQGLAPSGFVTQETLQQRQEDLKQADASVEQLDAQIAQTTIRAPFAGQIGLRKVNLGQYVNAGDALATLTALDQLYANFTVPQQRLSNLKVGGAVTIRTDAFPDRVFEAKINAIEPQVAEDTRNVLVQALFDNPDRLLRPGLFVTVNVVLPPQLDAIVVPVTAIQTSASGESVLVVRDNKAIGVAVKTGQRIGERVVVEHGLAPGDHIVTSGQLRVVPGAAVQMTMAETQEKGR
ncbi:MAG: efflux transporter, RND family, MFP subunit [Bradyrhizobium sp. DFCI-1]|jgi:membrane fusion protein, multidrug efflux system|nr:efflux RND transporter periplasmic adaptor subunit [Bradyrhizobium sp.]ERF86100.1 MAG: efflux transporter, RND family, MFP subunit [Bradyrhizobium sp. DFCI-1]